MNKIVIIQPSLPAYRLDFFKELASRLNIEITLIHFGEDRMLDDSAVIEIIGKYRNIRSLKYVCGLKKIINEYDTIITVFDPHWVNLFILPVLHSNKKIILWGHGLGRNKYINIVRKIFFLKSNSIITYSENKKIEIEKMQVDSKKIYVANNTLVVRNSKNTTRSSEKSFLFVGRLQRRKKLEIFFDIFANLKLGSTGFSITIIGDGEEEKLYLENYAMNIGIKNYVNFIPGTSDENCLLYYFSKALYYISPGAVGLGVLHSFAYGVPVLTIAGIGHGPELSNIVDNVNGFVFRDAVDFKESLPSILSSECATRLGNNSYRFFQEERDINQMVSAFIKAINH